MEDAQRLALDLIDTCFKAEPDTLPSTITQQYLPRLPAEPTEFDMQSLLSLLSSASLLASVAHNLFNELATKQVVATRQKTAQPAADKTTGNVPLQQLL